MSHPKTYHPSKQEILKKRKISQSVWFKITPLREIHASFPATDSYDIMVGNVEVKSNGTSFFMRTHRQTDRQTINHDSRANFFLAFENLMDALCARERAPWSRG